MSIEKMIENRKRQVYINVFIHSFVRMRKKSKEKNDRKLAFVETKNCDILCQVSLKVP